MKRFLLATVALAALSAPAAAADLATKYPVKAVAVPVFSWTGFYIGANAGYGGGSYSYDYAPGVVGTGDANSSGWLVGGQIGYNYQFSNNVVLGLETDLQWTDISGQVGGVLVAGGNTISGTKLDYFGTIRARLGYAVDRFLPYITGGVAYGDVKSNLINGGFWTSTSNTNWGWTLGVGAEYAVTNNWTFKAEYLYVDLGSNDLGPAGIVTASGDNKYNIVRAGVNYKF